MAEVFVEDLFTRITNVHWHDNKIGIFIAADAAANVMISEDGFTWASVEHLFGNNGLGHANDGAFGGGVFFLVGDVGSESFEGDRTNIRHDALALASANGRAWQQVASAHAPGPNDTYFYRNSKFFGSGFQYQLVQSHFDTPDGPTLQEFSNAGADNLDDPTTWNATNGFGPPAGTVGPAGRRVTLNFGTGFKVVTKDAQGREQVTFSTVPHGPRYLCYGGMQKRVFVANGFGSATEIGDISDRKIWASYDALAWTNVFTMPAGISALMGGLPQSLRPPPRR